MLSRPESASPIAISTAEYRELVFEWMRMIAAEALVDAFGIPDEVLRAPIAVR